VYTVYIYMYMVLANFKYDIMILGSQHSIRVIDICAKA